MSYSVLFVDGSGVDNDLPWLKDYLIENKLSDLRPEELEAISFLVVTDKGYLLYCKSFKAFAFKGSGLYDVLKSLLEDSYTGCLGLGSNGKKPMLISDGDAGDHYLHKRSPKEFEQMAVDPNNPTPPSTRTKPRKPR
jgi:hypothetical protein